MIHFTLEPRKPTWLAGARVVVTGRIENAGPDACELPNPMFRTSTQPEYRLVRPDGTVVSFAPNSNAPQLGPRSQAPLLRLEPGEAWEGEVALNDLVSLHDPGRYALEASIDWSGSQARAAAASFEVTAVAYERMAASVALGADGSLGREILLLQRSGGGPVTMIEGPLLEQIAGDALAYGPAPVNPMERGALPRDTTEILAPFANYDSSTELSRWIAGRSTAALHVGRDDGSAIVDIALPDPAGRVLTPLATKDLTLTVPVVLGGDAPALTMAFVSSRGGTTTSSPLTNVAALPHAPVAAASALGPESAGSPAIVATIGHTPTGSHCVVLTVDRRGTVVGRIEHAIDGMFVVPAAGVWRAADGRVFCGFLASTTASDGTHPLHFVELIFDGDMIRQGNASGPIGVDVTAAQEGQVAYFEPIGGSVTRAVWIRERDGNSIVRVDTAPARRRQGPASPVALVPGTGHWYLVHFDDRGHIAVDEA
jgi:hypothetical protein